jgi:hypothetical protein
MTAKGVAWILPLALAVTIGRASAETNATQLTLRNRIPLQRGDAVLATFWVRGEASGRPARLESLFERATDPWTKSVTYPAVASALTAEWTRVDVPFTLAESYAPGEALASFRLDAPPRRTAANHAGVRRQLLPAALPFDRPHGSGRRAHSANLAGGLRAGRDSSQRLSSGPRRV